MNTIRGCDVCKRMDVKLWRDYGQFFGPFDLLCAVHVKEKASDQFADIVIDQNGFHASTYEFSHGRETCEVDGWVPAVETDDGEGWWGYTSIPQDEFEKWKDLPNE